MSKLKHLCKHNSALSDIMLNIRDIELQNDRLRFRQLLSKAGSIMAYEMSKELHYTQKVIHTPLASTHGATLPTQPVIASVLRAGLPLQEGVSQTFPEADLAFISAYRYYNTQKELQVNVGYVATPDLTDRILILCDPMLATGHSMHLVFQELIKYGVPSQIHLFCILGSKQGVEYTLERIPEATLWIADIDPDLDDRAYIVPGLGDAGDLCYGPKLKQLP